MTTEEDDEGVFEMLRSLIRQSYPNGTIRYLCNAIDHIRKMRSEMNTFQQAYVEISRIVGRQGSEDHSLAEDVRRLFIRATAKKDDHLRAAVKAFFTPDRTKTLSQKIEELRRSYGWDFEMVVESGPILRFAQEDTEKFELRGIELSAGSWPTSSIGGSISVLKGHELVIRQDGHHIEVIRRTPSGWRTDFENMPDDKTICFFWKDGHHDALAGAVCAMSFGHKNTKWLSPPSHWAIIGPPAVSS